MAKLLTLKNVHKIFGQGTVNENHVLKGIDLELEKGDFTTVIGSNGAGKSTLLNAVAGSFAIDEGDIYLLDKRLNHMPAFQRAKYVSRVFQDPQMGTARDLTIEENLAVAYNRGRKKSLGLAITNDMRDLFREKLARLNMGLEDRLKVRASSLSGGQRQVLTLLMAVLQTPEILLLDEHTAALDPRASSMVLSLTEELVEEDQISTLMITHNMEDAVKYGNRLIMLHQGQIVNDISGEEKENLTVDDLLDMFQQDTGAISDNLALS